MFFQESLTSRLLSQSKSDTGRYNALIKSEEVEMQLLGDLFAARAISHFAYMEHDRAKYMMFKTTLDSMQ